METLSSSPRALFGLILITALALAGCGAQATPRPAEQSQPAVKEAGSAVISADVTWDTAPEPALHTIGGIPAADLTAEPKYGGTLIPSHSFSTRLDPHFAAGPYGERWAPRVYGNGIVEWDLKCNCPKPELAESWKMVNDVTYDFKIRKGVKFHNLPPVNGREMTIQDVKWSLDRIAGVGERPKGVISINYSRFSTVKEFKIVDDTTLRMMLTQPDSMIFRELMYDYTMVMPKEAAVDGMFMEQKTLIGTGPFIVELAQSTGQSRFKKNPDYWKKDAKGRQLPYLDAIRTLGAGDAAATQAAMKTGQADWVIIAYKYGRVFEKDPQYRIYSTMNSAVGTSGLWMNVNNKPFDDVRVRRAINLAIDRREIGDATYAPGGWYPWTFLGSWEPFTWSEAKLWSMPGYAKSGPDKDKEVEEAKKLLAEAGFPNGFEFTCQCETTADGTSKAEVLSEQFKRIGVTMKVHATDSNESRWAAFAKDKQAVQAHMGGGHTPDYSLQEYFRCESAKNLAVVCDQKIEAWVKEFRAALDQKTQVEVLAKVQDYLWDMMPVANLTRPAAYHVSRSYVRNWRNPMYDCCPAHGEQASYVWLDK